MIGVGVCVVAASGHAQVCAYRRPRVAVLSTGNELSAVFGSGGRAQILDANRPALKALVRAWGGTPIDLGIVPDEPGVLSSPLSSVQADLLVITGGASVGAFDLVGPTLASLGFEAEFRKVRMRPGKATLFGRLGSLPVLGLPGNAVAELGGALVFLRPALSLLVGSERPASLTERTVLAAPLPEVGPRTTFLRGCLGRLSDGELTFAVLPVQDHAMLSGLAEADTLVVRPAGAPAAAIGEAVAIIRFDRLPGY